MYDEKARLFHLMPTAQIFDGVIDLMQRIKADGLKIGIVTGSGQRPLIERLSRDFQDFVEECHKNNIGVIVDWVPGHFTVNDDALAFYDGTPTFEYQDPDRAHNRGWGALNFDLGKNQVQSFLISSVKCWIDYYHLDGIRVDAVSNMIYRNYDIGPWTPNKDGGTRDYEGFGFLQKMNAIILMS